MRGYLSYGILIFLLGGLLIAYSMTGKQEDFDEGENLTAVIKQNFRDAADQYKVMVERLPKRRFPQTFAKAGDFLKTSGAVWWCSGFYPGALLLLYEETGEEALHREAEKMLEILEKEQFNTSTHDLGFMIYCTFGNSNSIAPQGGYQQVLMNSARSLASRFSGKVRCVRLWDSRPENVLVIIDNMMNLELLFWATCDSSFYEIAVTHANTTARFFANRDIFKIRKNNI